jgi:hypothetical protein
MQPHDAITLKSLTRLLIRNLVNTSELEALAYPNLLGTKGYVVVVEVS